LLLDEIYRLAHYMKNLYYLKSKFYVIKSDFWDQGSQPDAGLIQAI